LLLADDLTSAVCIVYQSGSIPTYRIVVPDCAFFLKHTTLGPFLILNSSQSYLLSVKLIGHTSALPILTEQRTQIASEQDNIE